MGIWRQIFETMGENISKSKEQRRQEEESVRRAVLENVLKVR